MAGYRLNTHGFADGKSAGGLLGRSRFGSWGIADDGVQPWGSWLFPSKADPADGRDHVCRPVVIGSDGKAMPPAVLDFPSGCRLQKKGGISNGDGMAKSEVPGSMFGRQKAGYNNSYKDQGSYGRKNNAAAPEAAESTLNTSGGWTRPSRAGWRVPAPEAPLHEEVKHDAHIATEFLTAKQNKKGAAAAATVKIDSREAAKKYGRTPLHGEDTPASAQLQGEVKHGAHIAKEFLTAKQNKKAATAAAAGVKIDSREAAKKYGGQFIW